MHTVRENRRQVLIRAKMRAGGPLTDVCIRDASSRGLMIQAKAAPPRGTYVEIVGENLTIVARVVWSKGHRFGVRTNEPIDVSATIRLVRAGAPHPKPAPKTGKLAAVAARSSAETSRALGKTLEFATIGAFVAALVVALALIVYEDLSRPLARIAEEMVGRR